ncbi:MAG TPA: hypothetical protein VGV09_02395 [Steroidobacteraceae bacterium]|nr:hypothetical protein [Steroidobacteraceae bacterium]
MIDQFMLQEVAVEEFLRHAHFSANIVKTRPGFKEGYVFRRTAGDGRVKIVTTAVWTSDAAMEEAKRSISTEFAEIGFDPAQIMKRLGVQIERGIYRRAAY